MKHHYYEVRYRFDRWSYDEQVGYGETFDEALEDARIREETLLNPQYTMQEVTSWSDEEGTHTSRKAWLSREKEWISL